MSLCPYLLPQGLRKAQDLGNAGTPIKKWVIRISLSSEMGGEIGENLSWELWGDGESSDGENEYLYNSLAKQPNPYQY